MVDKHTTSPGEKPLPLTDEDLIRQFQSGQDEAFTEIVHRYSNPLYNFIYRIIGDAAFAEDLLQETFLRLWQNRQSYREIAKFSTWLYTVAGNLAKSELRRLKVRRWISFSSGESDDRPLDFADDRSDPLEQMEQKIAQERIDYEIQKLPIRFREVIVLRDVQELSYEEISSILKIPLGTVKSRVNRGRLRLQSRLKDVR